MSKLKLVNIKKSYGAVECLKDINLEIESGEFIAFVGPSGSGKSTLLRCISGLESINGGELYIGDDCVTDVMPAMRGIAMVFQSYALYPHMTVYENIAFGLRIRKFSKSEVDKKIKETAEKLQLTEYLYRLPKELSGGQRQRVAIGRAIVRNPNVFLFDEPLSNLDAALRVKTRFEIAALNESMPDTTMIYVTHDQVEAMTLADRIVVLSNGKVEQVGTPLELYSKPANLFVAKFIGSPAMNILPASLILEDVAEDVRHIGIRPEHFSLTGDNDGLSVSGVVSMLESLGEVTMVYLDIEGLHEAVVIKLPGIVEVQRGELIKLRINIKDCHFFDQQGLRK